MRKGSKGAWVVQPKRPRGCRPGMVSSSRGSIPYRATMKRIIHVSMVHGTWAWRGPLREGVVDTRLRVVGWLPGYATADHAMRDAWTWCGGDVPALIFT